MREIKFRAWVESRDYPNDFMVNNVTLESFDGNYFKPAHVGITEVRIMQYIGLKDKCGLEVYEGDILDGSPLMVVVYNQELCGYVANNYASKYKNDYCFIDDLSDVEVIGNVYETPELLT